MPTAIATPVPPLPPIAPAADIDGVIARVQSVVDWSRSVVWKSGDGSPDTAGSRLGYFAALYLRITRAIGAAVNQFDDPARMQRFDSTFANRYFAALNGYFHPADHPAPSHCWRLAFDTALLAQPIIVQHMLLGVNAHIDLDLGVAAWEIMLPGPVQPLQGDFNKVNAVLGSQVKAVLDEIDEISPLLGRLYDCLQQDEIDLIDDGLIVFRDNAWRFACVLSAVPHVVDPVTITLKDAETAAFGIVLLNPSWPFNSIVAAIANVESRDVVHNIDELADIANEPL
jgi:Family of unknown function (DUF5995)